MTTDPPDPIAAAAERYQRDKDKAHKSRKALRELVLEALCEPEAEPVDIARRAKWTPAYVRKFAREHGIDADPAYKARTEKARARLIAEAASKPAPVAPRRRPAPVAPERPRPIRVERTRAEADAEVDRLYGLVRERATPQQWAGLEQLISAVPESYRKRALLGQAPTSLLSPEELARTAYTDEHPADADPPDAKED